MYNANNITNINIQYKQHHQHQPYQNMTSINIL